MSHLKGVSHYLNVACAVISKIYSPLFVGKKPVSSITFKRVKAMSSTKTFCNIKLFVIDIDRINSSGSSNLCGLYYSQTNGTQSPNCNRAIRMEVGIIHYGSPACWNAATKNAYLEWIAFWVDLC